MGACQATLLQLSLFLDLVIISFDKSLCHLTPLTRNAFVQHPWPKTFTSNLTWDEDINFKCYFNILLSILATLRQCSKQSWYLCSGTFCLLSVCHSVTNISTYTMQKHSFRWAAHTWQTIPPPSCFSSVHCFQVVSNLKCKPFQDWTHLFCLLYPHTTGGPSIKSIGADNAALALHRERLTWYSSRLLIQPHLKSRFLDNAIYKNFEARKNVEILQRTKLKNLT